MRLPLSRFKSNADSMIIADFDDGIINLWSAA